MIDKHILEEIGFTKASGFDHDVLVYGSDFWVHFDYDGEHKYNNSVNALDYSNKEFFKVFIEFIMDEAEDSVKYSIYGE